jgi:GDP-4-dehydro-6-deoxy-D-mannose reductase
VARGFHEGQELRKVIITGIAGFTGSHLADRLYGSTELWGVHIDDRLDNISQLISGADGVRLVRCDLTDAPAVLDLVKSVGPDCIFHLAAQSSPSLSHSRPTETFRVNVFSTLNILEAVSSASPQTVVLNVGSGDEYGDVPPGELPVRETAELRPTNPYAVSKVTQDLLGYQYWKSRGVKVVRCRPFNHLGPRQSDAFVASAFARQIAEIEAGMTEEKVLKVGNIEATRDFLYVKDVVDAYVILAEKGEYGEVYNISSGRSVKIREILDTLLSFSSERIWVEEDPGRLRKKDKAGVYGDSSRLKALGWAPRHGLSEGLKELLIYWRGRVSGDRAKV